MDSVTLALAKKYTDEHGGADANAVHYTADTGKTDAEKAQARANINAQANPSIVTTGTDITIADNTEYYLTDVTALTIAYPSGNFECWLRISTASSGTIAITLPTSSYIGSVPTFANSETWELSIKDGVVVAGKVVSA